MRNMWDFPMKSVLLISALSITFGAVSGFASEDGQTVLDSLCLYDQALLSSYTIQGGDNINDGNFLHPDDAWEFTATGQDDQQVLLIELPPITDRYTRLPESLHVYATLDQVDQFDGPDPKTHYARKILYLDGDSMKGRFDPEVVEIAEDRSIVKAWYDAPFLNNYGSDRSWFWLFYQRILVLGRGYGQLLDKVVSCDVDEEGIATVEATGNLFGVASNNSGKWVLNIDTKASYLVQSAVFTAGALRFSFESNKELVWDQAKELPLYSGGTLVSTGPVEKVWLTKYERTVNQGLLAEAIQKVNDMSQPDTTVVDFTLHDTDNNSWSHIVKEGE